MEPFVPTRRDVLLVRAELFSHGLPTELILEILDHARYWVERQHESTALRVLMDEEYDTEYTAAYPYLEMKAFPIETPFRTNRAEVPKIKEIEFLIVSHDQGWTTEGTKGTYDTSSFFEVSILTPKRLPQSDTSLSTSEDQKREFYRNRDVFSNVELAVRNIFPTGMLHLVRRPSTETEPQRMHCTEMTNITKEPGTSQIEAAQGGMHAWYLQSNEVARGASVFDGDMVRRYTIVWSSKLNTRWVGNEGTGSGENFIDTIKKDDRIVVWARAKRRGWENHIHGVRMTIRYSF
ncbi:hypothetical protein CC86DRAFT_59269 [Ophiobolus disseminans]|uniref:Uncharacterized protein n=1 Tax=Ophiobolus disseminans TaxID=1469910 RepID=A0A6A6ZRK1_9PLEO|nr:hypothetical protein CC86DRAFT_59269 [Ophiobolus disseminans]